MNKSNKILLNIKNLQNIMIVPSESKFWDMDMSLDELLKVNKDCYFERNYNPGAKHISGYIYLKHPNIDKYSVMIGLNSDGFTYYADSKVPDGLKLEKLDDVLQELMAYYYFNEIRLNNMER